MVSGWVGGQMGGWVDGGGAIWCLERGLRGDGSTSVSTRTAQAGEAVEEAADGVDCACDLPTPSRDGEPSARTPCKGSP